MDKEKIIRFASPTLWLVSTFEFLSALVGYLMDKSDAAFAPLLWCGLLTLAVGAIPFSVNAIRDKRQKNNEKRSGTFQNKNIRFSPDDPLRFIYATAKDKDTLSHREASMVIILSWILACLSGMVPYWAADVLCPLDALFESVSGFTTTGATVVNDFSALSYGMHFWRMSTCWIGGVGIIVFATTIVPSMIERRFSISMADVSSLSKTEMKQTFKSTAHTSILVYIALTVLCALLLWLSGHMRFFDAVTHAMSTISTCGFSTKPGSIADYDSIQVELILIIFMFLAGMSFTTIWSSFAKKRNILKNEVVRWYIAFVGISIMMVTISLVCSGGMPLGEALRYSAFHVTSLNSTTGFAVVDTNSWPSLCIAILLFVSVICACYGSTTGGIKMNRFVIAVKAIALYIRKEAQPNLVKHVYLNKKIISNDAVNDTIFFVAIYVMTLFVGYLFYTSSGMDSLSGFSASIACLGNVGPGFGEIGSMDNYTGLSSLAKSTSVVLMFLGRLEIISFARIFWLWQKK